MIPCGLRCSVHFLTNGGDDEKNNCINSVNCAGVRNCRGAVHFVPVGLCSSGRGIYGHCEQFMPIGLYVRRHSHQLYRVQPRRVMHYVRPCGCIVYRRHWDIRIHRGVCYGIGCSCWPRVRAGYIIPHPPSCSARPPPPHRWRWAFWCGTVREYALYDCDHPGTSCHPSAEGNLAFVPSQNKFPSIGGLPEHRAPRDVSRGWLGRGG